MSYDLERTQNNDQNTSKIHNYQNNRCRFVYGYEYSNVFIRNSTAAILLNPLEAFIVGGIGSFLGDMIFYPTPMFVSLFTHGIQALVISVFSHYILKKHPKLSAGIGVSIGVIIMVAGYTFGKAFIYSTPEYAIMKLPYEFAQGILGAVFGMLLVYRCGLKKLFNRIIVNREETIHELKHD